MRFRYACLVLGVLLVPGAAHADSHFADFYGGGSVGGGGSKLGGFIVALGKGQTQPTSGPLKKVLFGGVGGASVQFGSHDDGRSVTQVVWSLGPRFTFEKNRDSRNFIAQVTLAPSATRGNHKDFTTVVGAAWDWFLVQGSRLTPHPGWECASRLTGSSTWGKTTATTSGASRPGSFTASPSCKVK